MMKSKAPLHDMVRELWMYSNGRQSNNSIEGDVAKIVDDLNDAVNAER